MNETPADLDLALPPGLLKALFGMFRGPDRREALQTKLLELEVARAVAGAAQPYQVADFAELCEDRADWVILGTRGSGKTACAVSLGHGMASALGVPVFGVGWPDDAAAQVGVKALPWKAAREQRDAVLLLDEFRLLELPPAELWKLLALARQQGSACIVTAQSSAAVTPDVFRIGVRLAWKSVDLVGMGFERPELAALTAAARLVLSQLPAPSGLACFIDGRWLGAQNPLPAGWSERASKLWRRG